MTNNKEQIETIRQVCIKANPEIVELKFGCEVINNGISRFVTENRGNEIVTFSGGISFSNKIKAFMENFEIIGRPIRLADVLLAIKDIPVEKKINILGNDHMPQNSTLAHIVTFWKLDKDDLTIQSPETIAFIYELLHD